jgi:glycosyltransferase involved in cell wall biosynthesis
MKKVLFISYFFPPIKSDWRSLGYVKLLPEFGWQPIVISAAESVSYGKDYSLLQQLPDGTEVHRVGHREPSRAWGYARRKFKINYEFPDYYKSWYSPALREARKILQREKVDLIFNSSSPYTASFVAMQLKKEFGIPWITEFRDHWAGNDYLNLVYDETLIKPLRNFQKFRIIKGEKEIVKVADKTIVVSWHHKMQLCDVHGVTDDKISVITNGYDESDFQDLRPIALYPDKLTIAFLGNAYPGSQEIAVNFVQAVNEIDKDVEVVFIGGAAEEKQKVSMENLTRIGYLMKAKGLAFSSGCEFLLLITLPSAEWHIPMKIFDYLRIGKPILAITAEYGDAARIVKEAKAGFVLSHEQKKMQMQLKTIFEKCRTGEFKYFRPDCKYVAQFERRNLVKRLATVFNEITAPNSLSERC